MTTWLLSVAAVAVLTVLLEVLLSEGNTKKYIQGIIRLLLIMVILLPIVKLIKKDISYNDFLPETKIEEEITDKTFLSKISATRYKSAELKIQNLLKDKGINGALVSIDIYYGASYTIEISSVRVDLSNAVITSSESNIFINDIIIQAVQSHLIVDKEKIIIYGKN